MKLGLLAEDTLAFARHATRTGWTPDQFADDFYSEAATGRRLNEPWGDVFSDFAPTAGDALSDRSWGYLVRSGIDPDELPEPILRSFDDVTSQGLSEKSAHEVLAHLYQRNVNIDQLGSEYFARVRSRMESGGTAVESLDLAHRMELPTMIKTEVTSGVRITGTPGRTTTILGNFRSDMSRIIKDDLGDTKTMDFDAKPGSFNVLNVPDELYVNPDQFWDEYNLLFLQKAVARGDDIYMATPPIPSVLNRKLADGTWVRTGFGREFDYLTDKGYVYDSATAKMRLK